MVSSFKTSVLQNGRPSSLTPCESRIHIRERFTDTTLLCEKMGTKDDAGKLIFKQTAYDDKLTLSIEDQLFLDIMNREFHTDEARPTQHHGQSAHPI